MTKKPFFSQKKNVVLLAFVYTFLWGCAFPLVKICMTSFEILSNDNFSKMLVAGVRFFLSGIITLIISLFVKDDNRAKIKSKDLLFIISYGLFGTTLQYAFTYIGLSNISGSIGALFDQLCVFFIIIISGLFFVDDKLNFTKIAGCFFGFSGVAFTIMDGFSINFNLLGEGMMMLAAVSQTVAYIIAKKSVSHLSTLKFVGFSHFLGGGILMIFSYIMGGRILTINPKGIITMLLLVGISSIAYILSLLPLKYFSASEISVFNLLIPIFGGIMSGIYLKEDIFNFNYLFALLFVVIGIYLVNLEIKGKKQKWKTYF